MLLMLLCVWCLYRRDLPRIWFLEPLHLLLAIGIAVQTSKQKSPLTTWFSLEITIFLPNTSIFFPLKIQ